MTYQQTLQKIQSKKAGTFSFITYQSQLKTLVVHRDKTITKITKVCCRFGVDYNNLKSVKIANTSTLLNGEQIVNQSNPLPWGNWKQNLFPYIIEHINKKGEYNQYLRVTLIPKNRFKTKYFINGIEVNANQARKYCLASEFRDYEYEKDAPKVLTVNINNILEIR